MPIGVHFSCLFFLVSALSCFLVTSNLSTLAVGPLACLNTTVSYSMHCHDLMSSIDASIDQVSEQHASLDQLRRSLCPAASCDTFGDILRQTAVWGIMNYCGTMQ